MILHINNDLSPYVEATLLTMDDLHTKVLINMVAACLAFNLRYAHSVWLCLLCNGTFYYIRVKELELGSEKNDNLDRVFWRHLFLEIMIIFFMYKTEL